LSLQSKAQLEQVRGQVELQKLQTEAQLKFQLMQAEAQISAQLKSLEVEALKSREEYKEDRKDERTRIQASQVQDLKSLSLQVMIY